MENIFGKNLRRFRTDKNLTLKELAEKLGVKFQSVEKWEKGATMPNGKRIGDIVSILGVSQNDLYREVVEKNEFQVLYELEKEKNNELREQLIKYQAVKIQELQKVNS